MSALIFSSAFFGDLFGRALDFLELGTLSWDRVLEMFLSPRSLTCCSPCSSPCSSLAVPYAVLFTLLFGCARRFPNKTLILADCRRFSRHFWWLPSLFSDPKVPSLLKPWAPPSKCLAVGLNNQYLHDNIVNTVVKYIIISSCLPSDTDRFYVHWEKPLFYGENHIHRSASSSSGSAM